MQINQHFDSHHKSKILMAITTTIGIRDNKKLASYHSGSGKTEEPL